MKLFKKLFRKDNFDYMPMKGDWICIQGTWHNYKRVDNNIYFDGVKIFEECYELRGYTLK